MQMWTPIQRIRYGALILGVCAVVSIVGYKYFGGYSWSEAIWLVTITISTVGFSEHSDLNAGMQMFTIGVIVVGISAAGYTFGGFMQLAIEGEFERLVGKRRMSREIERLSGHVVICGYGRTGWALAQNLSEHGKRFVVIDNNEDRIEFARQNQQLVVVGDATDEEVLLEAGIVRASSAVSILPSDADNVFITLTVRNICPDMMIISRAEHPTTEKKLRQAGANRVVQPAVYGARTMARLVTRPSTAEFMELVADGTLSDMELDEVLVDHESKMVGLDVRETEARRIHKLLVIGVKQPSGDMIFNPEADYRFSAGEMVIIMGKRDDIARFRDQYRL